MSSRNRIFRIQLMLLLVVILIACSSSAEQRASQTASKQTEIAVSWTETPTTTVTATVTTTSTVTPPPLPRPEIIDPNWELISMDTFDEYSRSFSAGGLPAVTISLRDGKSVWKMKSNRSVTGFGLIASTVGKISDFYLSVEGKQTVCPTTCSYGLFFRELDERGYLFEIKERTQTFSFQLTTWSGTGNEVFNIDTFSSAINPLGPNVLAVMGDGDQISLFINDVLVTQVQDSTNLSGTVGIDIATWGKGIESEFEFDNFQVYSK